MKSAMSGQNMDTRHAAEAVLAGYRQLSPGDKRTMVSNFFKAGGMKAGLNSLYSQTVSHLSSAKEGQWRGYLRPLKW